MGRVSEVVAKLREDWRRKMGARRATAELAAYSPQDLHGIEADLGLSSTDLELLTCNHPGPSELMPQRLQQLGLDPNFVRRAKPETYLDLARICATCTAWRRCKHDLAHGDVQVGMDGYCRNSATIDELIVEGHTRQ